MIARSLFAEGRELNVFDFDDTIVKTDSFIRVTKRNGHRLKLTPGQYAKYVPQSGDEFDFSDFETVRNPKIIKAYFEVLKRMASKGTVYILTARSSYRPVYDFIRDTGIHNVFVVALSDSDPEKKADWIEKQIKDKKYDEVFFIDDSDKNIVAVRARLSKYPKIKSKIQLAKSS